MGTTRITKSRTFIREKKWKCSSCGTENPGRATNCSNCDSSKEADEKYESVGHGEVTDPALLKTFKAGANTTCPYCKSDVRADWEVCPECGACRNDYEGHIEGMGWVGPDVMAEYRRPPEPPKERVGLDYSDLKEKIEELRPPPKPEPVELEPMTVPFTHSPWKLLLAGAAGVAVMVALVWGGFYLFAPWETDATITGVQWRYHVDLQQRVVRRGAGWRSGMHVGAYNVRCERRQNGTENCRPHSCNCHQESYECNCTSHSCNCHETCHESCSDNGNGSETCRESCSETCDTCRECDTCQREACDTCYDQCPVYDDWCEYNWDDWPVVDQATTSGTDLSVYPPQLQARDSDQRLVPSTSYQVNFSTPNGARTYGASSVSDFQRFRPGRWRIKTNRAGMVWPLRRL